MHFCISFYPTKLLIAVTFTSGLKIFILFTQLITESTQLSWRNCPYTKILNVSFWGRGGIKKILQSTSSLDAKTTNWEQTYRVKIETFNIFIQILCKIKFKTAKLYYFQLQKQHPNFVLVILKINSYVIYFDIRSEICSQLKVEHHS